MRSIRRYLLVSLIVALAVGSLIVAGVTYLHAEDEINELYDRNMREVAATIESQMEALRLGRYHHDNAPKPELHTNLKEEQDYLVQLWDDRDAKLVYTSHAAPFPFQTTAGSHMADFEGKPWRTHVVKKAGLTIQVSQPQHARDLFVRELALSLLYPLLGLIPIVGGLIWLAVGRSLRPLHAISHAITKRSATSLEPIPENDIPLEVKPLVQELNELLVRLHTSLEAQRRFTADAAHELRTPLTALQLQLANLRRAKNEATRQEYSDKLQDGMDRAANVVRQLLAMARVEPNAAEQTMGDVDLDTVAHDVVVRFAQEAVEKHIDLGMQCEKPLLLQGNIENLRVLVENLVGNALRYTPSGGKVNVHLYQSGNDAILDVQDNGIGIPYEERERIFERFYRVLGSDTEGSGLGLAIAKNVVEQHQGVIQILDGIGGDGVTFRVRLPLG